MRHSEDLVRACAPQARDLAATPSTSRLCRQIQASRLPDFANSSGSANSPGFVDVRAAGLDRSDIRPKARHRACWLKSSQLLPFLGNTQKRNNHTLTGLSRLVHRLSHSEN